MIQSKFRLSCIHNVPITFMIKPFMSIRWMQMYYKTRCRCFTPPFERLQLLVHKQILLKYIDNLRIFKKHQFTFLFLINSRNLNRLKIKQDDHHLLNAILKFVQILQIALYNFYCLITHIGKSQGLVETVFLINIF